MLIRHRIYHRMADPVAPAAILPVTGAVVRAADHKCVPPVVLQPLIDTFIHKTLIHPQYLDFFMSSLMHFFVVLYCVSRETMV